MSVDTRRLKALRSAIRGETVKSEFAEPVAERIREVIIDSWSGVYPPASSPGSPPAIRTGELSRSVKVEKIEAGYKTVATAEHALYLEFGTNRMAPRPFMRPAIEQVRKEGRRFIKQWRRIFKRIMPR